MTHASTTTQPGHHVPHPGESPSVLAPFRAIREREPERALFTLVDGAGRDQETLTAGGLAAAAEDVARALKTWGIAPGERVVLVYPPGLEFVTAFVGCLIAGVLPVPVYPPHPIRLRTDVAGFAAVVSGCGARAALTTGAYQRMRALGSVVGRVGQGTEGWPDLVWHRTDRLPRTGAGPVAWHRPNGPDEVAFLQYTSGSTTAPRGVMITHGNLRHELAANAADLGQGPGTRCVSWVPQYHDLGLISVMLSALVGNGRVWLMSPMTFLRRPHLWFEVMSRTRATHTAAPNVAYDVAVRRTTEEQRSAWDLSALRVVMTAAEMIRPATVSAFAEAFAATGLPQDAVYGAYGLAEHTVSVTMGGRRVLRVDRAAIEDGTARPVGEDDDGVEYFSCGRVTKPGLKVLAVDPATRIPCTPGQVGEIWVDSPTKAAGYYGLPAETEKVFEARLRDGNDERRYLRTGDLGFFHEGELFLVGRLKDLIIVHGRNVHPQDVEHAARQCHPLIRPGGVAAFSVEEDGQERVVVFTETTHERTSLAQRQNIADAVRTCLAAELQIAVHAVVVSRRGLVRKTTSGKIRRSACRQAYLDGAQGLGAATVVRMDSPEPSDTAQPGAAEGTAAG